MVCSESALLSVFGDSKITREHNNCIERLSSAGATISMVRSLHVCNHSWPASMADGCAILPMG